MLDTKKMYEELISKELIAYKNAIALANINIKKAHAKVDVINMEIKKKKGVVSAEEIAELHKKLEEVTKVFKAEEAVKWHCGNCGHVYEGEEAPQVCPVCAHPQSYFRIKAENY